MPYARPGYKERRHEERDVIFPAHRPAGGRGSGGVSEIWALAATWRL